MHETIHVIWHFHEVTDNTIYRGLLLLSLYTYLLRNATRNYNVFTQTSIFALKSSISFEFASAH